MPSMEAMLMTLSRFWALAAARSGAAKALVRKNGVLRLRFITLSHPVSPATRPCSETRSLNMWPSIGCADGSGRGPTMSQGSDSSPSPPVGEGGCDAKHRSRVRGLSPRMQTLIRRGLRIADAKASASYLKERRPEAAYCHLLPQREKGRGATEARDRYRAS